MKINKLNIKQDKSLEYKDYYEAFNSKTMPKLKLKIKPNVQSTEMKNLDLLQKQLDRKKNELKSSSQSEIDPLAEVIAKKLDIF